MLVEEVVGFYLLFIGKCCSDADVEASDAEFECCQGEKICWIIRIPVKLLL